jgi:hypothetical protein
LDAGGHDTNIDVAERLGAAGGVGGFAAPWIGAVEDEESVLVGREIGGGVGDRIEIERARNVRPRPALRRVDVDSGSGAFLSNPWSSRGEIVFRPISRAIIVLSPI